MRIRHVETRGQARTADLFETLAALARDEVATFPALRPHQRQPWHAFLVQVAAMALHRAGLDGLPDTAEAWRQVLLALTPDWPEGEAWSLVVEDWTRPALLQPPVTRAADAAEYKAGVDTPDALDMLVTSKNHDLKAERMAGAGDDDWLFALVTLQTYEGFMGAGNFGVSRMNGGFGSRVAFGVRPDGGPGAAFRRDVRHSLATRSAILSEHSGLAEAGGAGLLWLEPWDGRASRPFKGLDPFYVEICRRVRLVRAGGGIVARVAGSKAARIDAKELAGRTGDPWAPVMKDGTKSYGPTGAGFGYRQMARLMNPEIISRPPLGTPRSGDAAPGLSIVASAVVRGQGKTEGYHERRLPVPGPARRLFAAAGGAALDRTGLVAQQRADEAAAMSRVLRHALFALVRGGVEDVRLDDDAADRKATAWLRLFDARVDAGFFDEAFWTEVAEPEGPYRVRWRRQLREVGHAVLEEAMEAAPRTDVRRIRARAQALNLFERRAGVFVKEADDAR